MDIAQGRQGSRLPQPDSRLTATTCPSPEPETGDPIIPISESEMAALINMAQALTQAVVHLYGWIAAAGLSSRGQSESGQPPTA
jgi:hypothetical protein